MKWGKKIKFSKEPKKKLKSTRVNIWNIWPKSWSRDWSYKIITLKIMIKILKHKIIKDQIEKKNNKKESTIKQIVIKRKMIKFDRKINWNKMLRDEIENKIQLGKG